MQTVPTTREAAERELERLRAYDGRPNWAALFPDRVLAGLRDERVSFLNGYMAAMGWS